jgi:hypothetical protein
VLCVIDDLIDPLEKAIVGNKAVKEASAAPSADSTPLPELERFIEQLRSLVRLICSLNKIEDISGKLRWQDFLARIQKKALVGDMLTETRSHHHDYGDIVM